TRTDDRRGRASCCLAPPGRLDRRDVDLAHLHHRLEGAPATLAAFSQCLEQYVRRDLPGNAPAVLAPAALARLAAIADNGVPVAVGLLLVARRHLEGERLAMGEIGTAIQADTGYAEDIELDGDDVARLAGRIVGRCAIDVGAAAVGKDFAIEACCRLCVLVEPEAYPVPDHGASPHICALTVPNQAPWGSWLTAI